MTNKIPKQQGQEQQQWQPKPESKSEYEQKKHMIYNTGIRLGSQLILFRNLIDFFLCKIHPGILDNSIKVEFVTSKTATNAMVRFLNRQTPEYRYYYSCYHCYDISKATFGTTDEYERHIVTAHKPGTVGYPGGPDIERIELEKVKMTQRRREW